MDSIFKKTKIVSTSGPAITKELNSAEDVNESTKEIYAEVLSTLEDLFIDGVNCVRFNFSHSNNKERLFRLQLINDALEQTVENAFKHLNTKKTSNLKFVRPVSNMCDTKGPEIRVFKMKNSDGQKYEFGSKIKINCINKIEGDASGFSVLDATGHYNMSNDCVIGNKILVDDGKLSLKIVNVDVKTGVVDVVVENTHTLKSNKRINLPGADYSMPFLSETDIQDIKFSFDKDFHLVALSFVNKAQNVLDAKDVLIKHNKNNKKLPLFFSKIETLYSLKNLDEIIEVSDGIMVARGDLGLEIPYYEVPYWTKVIVKKCAIKNIPVIVATQMLDSLERNIIPTRAEVSDVYRAAELGADSTMLSGETAQGLFPLIAVQTMKNIVVESEKRSNYDKFFSHMKNHPKFSKHSDLLKKLEELNLLLKQHGDDVIGIAGFLKDFSSTMIEMISCAKLSASLNLFEPCKDVVETMTNPIFNLYSIHRGINLIGVINLNDSIDIENCFKDYIISYSYKFAQENKNKKMILFLNNSWIVKNINF